MKGRVGGTSRRLRSSKAIFESALRLLDHFDDISDALLDIDEREIRRVVKSILGLALHDTPGGAPVTVRLGESAGAVRLSIADFGEPVEADCLPGLPDDPDPGGVECCTTRRSLKMAIAHRIVREHSGWIETSRSRDSGTVVTVELPVPPGGGVPPEA